MSTAMREAFGKHMAEIGKDHPEMIVLDADVSSSTKSALFGKAFPERFFNVGVAEGNLAGVAAGLATAGLGLIWGLIFYSAQSFAEEKLKDAWRAKCEQVLMKGRSLRSDAEFTQQLDYYESLLNKK